MTQNSFSSRLANNESALCRWLHWRFLRLSEGTGQCRSVFTAKFIQACLFNTRLRHLRLKLDKENRVLKFWTFYLTQFSPTKQLFLWEKIINSKTGSRFWPFKKVLRILAIKKLTTIQYCHTTMNQHAHYSMVNAHLRQISTFLTIR